MRAAGNHVICSLDDNVYEIFWAVAWIGWHITVFVYVIKLIEAVNITGVELR